MKLNNKNDLDYKDREILELKQKLTMQINGAEQSQKLQQALFKISELASGAEELNSFYLSIHNIISQLLYADNFYIALTNQDNNQLELVYFVDAYDEKGIGNLALSNKSLSSHAFKMKKSSLFNEKQIRQLEEQGLISRQGTAAHSWLGAPLILNGKPIGIIVIQSYSPDITYDLWHSELLEYISQQLAITFQRKSAREELEFQIAERTEKLKREVEEHKKSQETQSALYQIANLASTEIPLSDFYQEIHRIVGSLIYSENFYIVLKDSSKDTINVVYYVDTVDSLDLESISALPIESLKNSITVYVMNSGKSLLVSESEMEELTLKAGLEVIGEETKSWLGIPLVIEGNVIGVMTIQSYIPEITFTQDDKDVMQFVGQHVASAIERKKSKDYLHFLVEKRTHELTETNSQLEHQIVQRKKSEELQTALYKISKTPQKCKTTQELYVKLHQIISHLMHAKNLRIALIDEKNENLVFDYIVDEYDLEFPRLIPFGNSIASYVYRRRETVHLNYSELAELEKQGKLKIIGKHPHNWVGVPLMVKNSLFGILILQSYDEEYTYNKQDIEILNFVSTNIAEALERKRADTHLKDAYRSLAKKSKKAEAANEAKSSFLATMSHEIRTPMNGILGLLSLLSDTNLDETQKDYANKISISANSLLGIINDILDFSKIEEGKLELESIEFDLIETLDNLVDIFSASIIEKSLTFNIDIAPDVSSVLIGDPLRLSQILINLIGNAIKFTSKGIISLIINTEKEGYLSFQVKDTGIGIKDEQIEKVFDSFSQADGTTTRNFGGSGLGLSICLKLVSMMDGELKVCSEYGVGSCFSFHIKLPQTSLNNEYTTKFDNHNIALLSNNKLQTESWRNFCRRYQLPLTILLSENSELNTEKLASQLKNVTHLFLDDEIAQSKGYSRLKPLFSQSENNFILCQPSANLYQQSKIFKDIPLIGKPTKMKGILELLGKSGINIAPTKREDPKKSRLRKKLIGKTILLAEDNIINQQIAREILQQAGAIVTIVENGSLAVAACSENQFDMVLMDMQMPVMDGYRASEVIRAENTNAQLPIIAMTANVMKGDREKCLEHGMNDYIGKPINRVKLFEIIEKYF